MKKNLEQLSKRYSKKEINKEFSSSVTIGKIRHILVLHTSLITSYDIAEKIKILGEGESKLLVKTKDETKHPANRRAEISPSN